MSVASQPTSMAIRSFRICFEFERRIHKIDRWRLPVPFGVPLRGAMYAIAAVLAVVILGRLPVIGAIASAPPPPLRFVLIPGGLAYFLTQWEVDGRPAHATCGAWLRLWVAPRRLVAFAAAPARTTVALGSIAVAPDECSVRLRPGTVVGPARVVLRYPFAARTRGRTLHLTGEDGAARWRGKAIEIPDGHRVAVR
jgi:hypothetical protein